MIAFKTANVVGLLLVCMVSSAQGIRFQQFLSLEQLKTKAREENKFIFVDAYATWCVPCKEMDRYVYTDKKVGDYMNDNYLSIKIQMDSTASDSDEVRRHYNEARFLQRKYSISAFPTYLFFSPDGKLVHKAVGFKPAPDFISLTKTATDSSSQYYTLLEKYKRGEKIYDRLPYLTDAAGSFGDSALSIQLAEDYKNGYLDKIPLQHLFRREHFDFMMTHGSLFTSNDRMFDVLYFHGDRVDSILHEKWADRYVKFIILREEVLPRVYKDRKFTVPISRHPAWNRIRKIIARKYNPDIAESVVFDHKLFFYKTIVKNWVVFARLRDEKIVRKPPKEGRGLYDDDGTWSLNVDAWDVFLNCDNRKVLEKALRWSELTIRLEENDQYLDTKANLLYKLGRVEEAIKAEEKAIEVAGVYAQKNGFSFDPSLYQEILNKMRAGIPTWTKKNME